MRTFIKIHIPHSIPLDIALTGVTAALLHPLRSLVSLFSLILVLVPYLTATGLSQGIAREADASIRFGADLYVSGEQLGRSVPIPLTIIKQIERIPGVTSVTPRIVGTVYLGLDREPAVVVGLPAASLSPGFQRVEGRLYREGSAGELVVGTELARRLHLHPGSLIPPFYHNDRGEHIMEVVGVFHSEVSLWQSRMLLTSFETAATIFALNGTAGDLLVSCHTGTTEAVRGAIRRLWLSGHLSGYNSSTTQCRVVTRSDLEALIPAGLLHQSGLFHLLYLLAFVVGILTLMVSSGIGLSERRREIGILKATGWQTDEVLLRAVSESALISVGAASLSLLLAYVWLKLLNGYGIASLLLPGVGWVPGFDIPYRLTPLPALLCYLFAWIIMTSGTLVASWWAATASPREALR